MKEIPVTFQSAGEQVVGMLHRPSAQKKCAAVVCFHGFTGNKQEQHRLFVLTARKLADAGVASLRIDFRGSGDSAGDFSEMTITRELEDARAAVRFIRRRAEVDARRIGVLGMSMGGLVSALLLGEDPKISTAVLWCPVADFGALIRSNRTYMTNASYEKSGIADYGGWPVGRAFIEDGLKLRPVEALANSRAEVLILHGDHDESVPVAESALYKNVSRRVVIAGADHTFNSLAWTEQVISESVSWLTGHLSSPARDRRGTS